MLGVPRFWESTLTWDRGVCSSAVTNPATTEMSLGTESRMTTSRGPTYSFISSSAVKNRNWP